MSSPRRTSATLIPSIADDTVRLFKPFVLGPDIIQVQLYDLYIENNKNA